MQNRKRSVLGVVMAGALASALAITTARAADTGLSKAEIEDAKEGIAPVTPLVGAAGAMLGAGACALVAAPAAGLCATAGGAIGASIGAIATHRANRELDRIANRPRPPLYDDEWRLGDGVRLPRRRSPFTQSYNFPSLDKRHRECGLMATPDDCISKDPW